MTFLGFQLKDILTFVGFRETFYRNFYINIIVPHIRSAPGDRPFCRPLRIRYPLYPLCFYNFQKSTYSNLVLFTFYDYFKPNFMI